MRKSYSDEWEACGTFAKADGSAKDPGPIPLMSKDDAEQLLDRVQKSGAWPNAELVEFVMKAPRTERFAVGLD